MVAAKQAEVLPAYKDSLVTATPRPIRIGLNLDLKPFITAAEIKGHLRLLNIFHKLQETVEKGQDPRLPDWCKGLSTPVRWAWFVNLAVERCTFIPVSLYD